MNVFMTGGTGFVGTTLSEKISTLGHGVTVLTRSAVPEGKGRGGVRYVTGDPTQTGPWQQAVEGHDVFINLAGPPFSNVGPGKRSSSFGTAG